MKIKLDFIEIYNYRVQTGGVFLPTFFFLTFISDFTLSITAEKSNKVSSHSFSMFFFFGSQVSLLNISIEMQNKGMVVSSHTWNNKTKLKALLPVGVGL